MPDQLSDATFREFILNVEENRHLWRMIAMATAAEVLERHFANAAEANADQEFFNFFHDISMYLQSWLMLSLRNGQIMDLRRINQSQPDLNLYLQAFARIRDVALDKPTVRKEMKISDAAFAELVNAMKQYLTEGISELKLIHA